MRLEFVCPTGETRPLVALSAKGYRTGLRRRIETWLEFLQAELNRDENIAFITPYSSEGWRARYVNKKKPSIAIEIRFNEFDGDGYRILASDDGAEAATRILASINRATSLSGRILNGHEDRFLSGAKCPAVIVEPCHVNDFASMCFYRRPFVEAIAKTIRGWLKNEMVGEEKDKLPRVCVPGGQKEAMVFCPQMDANEPDKVLEMAARSYSS